MSYKIPGLQAARVAAGHSISRLAHLANVGDATITALENNELPRHVDRPQYTVQEHVAKRIADALGTDLATLGAVDLNA